MSLINKTERSSYLEIFLNITNMNDKEFQQILTRKMKEQGKNMQKDK